MDNRLSPPPMKNIRPANVDPAPFVTVSGTITVRLDGVLTDAQTIDYTFLPEFPGNTGQPERVGTGTYFIKADNVPLDQSHLLTVYAVYDSSIQGRDGVIEKRGRTTTGKVKINIPFSDEGVDFGVQFLDLR